MMKKIVVKGKAKLVGNIKVSGAKNAALPIIVSSLLCKDTLKLRNIPNLADITTLIYLLNHLGVKVALDGDQSNKDEGKVIEFNEAATETPEILNEDSYEKGWLVKIEPTGDLETEQADLLEYEDYKEELE